jgi:PilZ domain
MNGLQSRPAEPRCAQVTPSPKRRIERAHVNTPVVLTLHGQGFRGWMNDVSEGGVGLISVAALQQNDEVSVTLNLPGQPQPLTLQAVVRHTRGFHHGCQFVDAATGEQTRLKRFLNDAAKPPATD